MNRSSPRKNIFYLTFSYYPSGVFKSQIFDVIKLLREMSDQEVKLISFFSVRVYFKCRKWVKKDMPDAIVLPIIFGMQRWKMHSKLLHFFVGKKDFIIGRNPMGARVGLNYFNNVIYDGRSALKGEIEEYNMALNGKLDRSFMDAEKYVVANAKLRLAVSSELTKFWQDDLGYNSTQHLITPCSLGYSHDKALPEREINKKTRLLFSGGGSPWQSQKEKYDWIEKLLKENEDLEFVFLTKTDEHINRLLNKYPDRIERKWLEPEEVHSEMCKADYGILLRKDNLTNRVSAPVKFAEYLNAGLGVIISSCVKDYAKFVSDHNCGLVLDTLSIDIDLKPQSSERRKHHYQLAQDHFSKNSENIRTRYQKVLDFINA